MSELAKAGPTPPAKFNPLTQLPAALVLPAGKFYAFYSDSLKGVTGLVTRLTHWIAEEGLTEEDALEAMRRLMRPAAAKAGEYPGKILAALAEVVERLIDDRRGLLKREGQRRRADDEKRDSLPAAKVREAMTFFRTPDED